MYCCLAAPGDLEGATRVIAPRRHNTRGSLTPTIHTQSCLIPIITWCHIFFHSNQYSAHQKQSKVWIESNRSLRCHVTTLSWWQVSQSPPPPVAKMLVSVFTGDCACKIKLRQTGVICFPWRQRSWSCGVFKVEFQIHTVLSHGNGKFYTTMMYTIRASAGRYVFRCRRYVFRLLDAGLAFVQAGVSSCPDDVREFQMWRRRCKQIDPHWFQGRQMHFWWMLSTISWK